MNPTIVKLALAALLGRKRFVLLLLFPGALIALTLLIRALSSRPEDASSVLLGVGTSLVLPLLALVAATAVMGPEVDDGSLVYLLAKPVSRYAVAASKYVVALASVLLLGPLLLWVVGAAVDPDNVASTSARALGAAAAAAAYTALFLALSTLWKHAVVAGLLLVLLWEGTLANLFSGIAWLSVGQWGQRVAAMLDSDVHRSDVSAAWAVAALVVVTVGGVWFSGDRLRSFSLRGED